MKHMIFKIGLLLVLLELGLPFSHGAAVGLFPTNADIGKVSKPGSTAFDSSEKAYVISGGGDNMWFTNDAFQFAWKPMSGDFALQAVDALRIVELIERRIEKTRCALGIVESALTQEARHDRRDANRGGQPRRRGLVTGLRFPARRGGRHHPSSTKSTPSRPMFRNFS